VIAPIEGGPSWRLGVQPGDLITHINGESTKPITSQDAAGLETMDYLEFIARVTSHIPDKGQVMVRYYGLYANAHRGKVRKTVASPVTLSEEDRKPVPSNSRWTRSLSFFGVF
jgi:hypothetical protein